MNTKTILLAALTLQCSWAAMAQEAVPTWPSATVDARAGSRWWWMGSAVDEHDLQTLIGEYSRCGIGALEVTPIYGVEEQAAKERSYLSASWFEALAAAQAAAEANGMRIDMNGGTGWPFGGPWVKTDDAAGKLVEKHTTLSGDGAKELTWNVSAPEGNATLNRVLAYQGNSGATDITDHVDGRTLRWTAPEGEWLVIAVYNGHTLQAVKRAAPGGEGYVLDHYDAGAVGRYLAHFDEAFANNAAQWPRSFFNDSYEVYGADWTPAFFDEFARYRGYRLEDHMPELLRLRTDPDNKVLADYRETLSDMLLNNFTRPWTAWANGHGATTRNQGHGSPGNLLDFYAAVDIPEIEGFGLTDFRLRGLRQDPGFVRQNLSDFSTLKYASSAAHVEGKPLTSSETFTWLTEHFRTSLSQMKPDLDLMFAAGVNHVFFHGTTYSPPSAQWPGWKFYASIDMSPTNSIWADAPALMQYIERCQSFLQYGQPDNDVLVYAPFRDAMHRWQPTTRLMLFDINTLSDKMPEIVTTVRRIEAAGLDCDYSSDRQLLGLTLDGSQLVTTGGTHYSALVIPASKYMPEDVREHLGDLSDRGARIIWGTDGDLPLLSGAQPEQMRTKLGLRVLRRSNATGHHYFIANLQEKDVEAMMPIAVPFADAAFFNPLDGTISHAVSDGQGRVLISLRSGESTILQTYDTALSMDYGQLPPTAVAPLAIGGPWTLTMPGQHAAEAYAIDSLCGWQGLSTSTAAFMGTATYETTFTVTPAMAAIADRGFRLNLGDVRESARVWVNGDSIGTVWSVPFAIDIPAASIRQGENRLRIDVTNLPANHIRQTDIDGVKWRIFKDVNILDINNGQEGVSGITSYASWQLMPSGLCSDVSLSALHSAERSLSVEQVSFVEDGEGNAYPLYRIATPDGTSITSVAARLASDDTTPYTAMQAAVADDGSATLSLREVAEGYVHIDASDASGKHYDAYILAAGAYEPLMHIDFTADEAPLCGWNKMANGTMAAFTGNGSVERYVAKKSGKVVTTLYDGLTFTSPATNYFYFYPGYGLCLRGETELTISATRGTIAMLNSIVGSADDGSTYDADRAANSFTQCTADADGLRLRMQSQDDYVMYRHLDLYRPKAVQSGMDTPQLHTDTQRTSTLLYDMQGRPMSRHPQRGLYITPERRKVILK